MDPAAQFDRQDLLPGQGEAFHIIFGRRLPGRRPQTTFASASNLHARRESANGEQNNDDCNRREQCDIFHNLPFVEIAAYGSADLIR